jgi:diamine N-acetyltransferase
MQPLIHKIGLESLAEYKQIGVETFEESFRTLNNHEDFNLYMNGAFADDKLKKELSDENSEIFLVYYRHTVIGYLKINENGSQTELKEAAGLEIERIYVKKEYQGQKIGEKLLDFAINQASEKKKKYVWLGVWEKNLGAQKFYKRHEFEQFSEHDFYLGNDRQTDVMMKLEL